jgi:hypothetical protein
MSPSGFACPFGFAAPEGTGRAVSPSGLVSGLVTRRGGPFLIWMLRVRGERGVGRQVPVLRVGVGI